MLTVQRQFKLLPVFEIILPPTNYPNPETKMITHSKSTETLRFFYAQSKNLMSPCIIFRPIVIIIHPFVIDNIP